MIVSVVIPARNEENYLPNTLKSILGQVHPDFGLEVIVANDIKSTDRTSEIIKEFGVVEIKTKEPTPAYARQKGVEKAKGEIIVCVDADTILPKNHLLTIVSEFEKDPKLVGLAGFMDAWGGNFLQRFFYKWSNILYIVISFSLGKPGFQGQSFAFRKSAFLKIGGFKTTVHTCEDMDLGYRMRKAGRVKLLFKIFGTSSTRRMKKEPLFKAVSRGFLSYLRLLWGLPLPKKEKEPFPAIR